MLIYKCAKLYSGEKRPAEHTTRARPTCPFPRKARLELDLADGLPEVLSLDLGDLELERRGLARAVPGGEGAGAPGGTCGGGWRQRRELSFSGVALGRDKYMREGIAHICIPPSRRIPSETVTHHRGPR